VHKDAVVQDADVIILHWVNGGMLSIKAIENILKLNKPVYWFMHDMWPITGGCHHAFECEKYKSHCERCPMANNMRGSRVKRDWSHIQFAYKMKHLSRHSNLHFITPSKWLADKVSESALFGRHDVHVCRNVLDTNIFTPCDKVEARKRLHLPLGKKLILFGADNLSSPYKGWPYLRDALSKPIDGAECVLYGNCDQDLQSQIAINVNSLGKISDTHKLVDLYSACDVFVTPSLADNYPNVIIEAMACGLPIVGFATGGIPEMIATGRDGIVVNAYDSTALRDAILSVLDEPTINYSQNAINRVNVTNSYAAEKTDLIRVITQ
jgi:glycosyltransferase involved in cell wall biosynthesis